MPNWFKPPAEEVQLLLDIAQPASRSGERENRENKREGGKVVSLIESRFVLFKDGCFCFYESCECLGTVQFPYGVPPDYLEPLKYYVARSWRTNGVFPCLVEIRLALQDMQMSDRLSKIEKGA